MNFRLSLKIKIILFFITAAGIAGVVASYIGHAYIKSEVYELKKQDYRLIAEGYAEELAQVFLQAENIAEKISQREEISNYLSGDNKERQRKDILQILVY
jgi:hypothetical protein